MGKNRLEAFSDGVLAIVITIMVLELKVPHSTNPESLLPIVPVFISYVLSFVYVAIYWNNHHHMLHAVNNVSGSVLWANIHLLFWLSLVPFTTAWMGENSFSKWPVILYGFVLLMAGIAYYMLAHSLIRLHGRDSRIAKAVGNDKKGKLSVLTYALAIIIGLFYPVVSVLIYAAVAAIWFIPDSRIEKLEKEKR